MDKTKEKSLLSQAQALINAGPDEYEGMLAKLADEYLSFSPEERESQLYGIQKQLLGEREAKAHTTLAEEWAGRGRLPSGLHREAEAETSAKYAGLLATEKTKAGILAEQEAETRKAKAADIMQYLSQKGQAQVDTLANLLLQEAGWAREERLVGEEREFEKEESTKGAWAGIGEAIGEAIVLGLFAL